VSNVKPHVLVVGGGNAGLTAALAASDAGARVTVLERAPLAERGGDSRFTGGVWRIAFETPDEIAEIVPGLSAEDRAQIGELAYGADRFFEDFLRVTGYRCDPDLAGRVVDESQATLAWMARKGARFVAALGRNVGGDKKMRAWQGTVIESDGGGPGLIDDLVAACERDGIEIVYGTRAIGLVRDDGGAARGVRVRAQGRERDIASDAVILACGGFQADPARRAQHLGAGWDLAKVRGTRFNTGDGLAMALDAGAMTAGNFSGAHAIAFDFNAGEFGDLARNHVFERHSFHLSLLINRDGKRFSDEARDFPSYTYASNGRTILAQPGQMCWQVFDAKVAPLLRDEYRTRHASFVQGQTLEELARAMDGVDEAEMLRTIAAFNAAVPGEPTFDPSVLDGRATAGLEPPKSNWALALDTPPFQAFPVTCGITFTFGGLKIVADGGVASADDGVIPGLYACGEIVGGLYYFNYGAGSGLTSGSVIGRAAAAAAVAYARG